MSPPPECPQVRTFLLSKSVKYVTMYPKGLNAHSTFFLPCNIGIDAALYMVSELKSKEVAEAVATHIEYTWHRVASEDPFADDNPYTRS